MKEVFLHAQFFVFVMELAHGRDLHSSTSLLNLSRFCH
jgi:hypothetical protein